MGGLGPGGGPGPVSVLPREEVHAMETYMAEALRLWLRRASIAEVMEVLELFRGELGSRNVDLVWTTEYRVPAGGSPQG